MLTRSAFAQRFGRRAVIGMLHLAPLPGAPLYEGSLEGVLVRALADVEALASGGVDAIAIENFGDRRFRKNRVEPETIAAMTRIITEVAHSVALPFGVNVLRNDAAAALAIAAATGAAFIRVNVHTGAVLADQGIIEGQAAETLRRPAAIAPEGLSLAKHDVKHATSLVPRDPIQSARDLRLRGLAEVLGVEGTENRAPSAPPRRRRLAEAPPDVRPVSCR